MNQLMITRKTITLAVHAGLLAVILGAAMFALSWYFYDALGGPMPGTQVVLFPGHLSLVYVWHPLFTEEINFWPKFTLQMFGQFSIVTVTAMVCVGIAKRVGRAIWSSW
tara:strand:- start:5466 stop:5792 length:327 start_codon:yes stop_codon:yes gene_type:complete